VVISTKLLARRGNFRRLQSDSRTAVDARNGCIDCENTLGLRVIGTHERVPAQPLFAAEICIRGSGVRPLRFRRGVSGRFFRGARGRHWRVPQPSSLVGRHGAAVGAATTPCLPDDSGPCVISGLPLHRGVASACRVFCGIVCTPELCWPLIDRARCVRLEICTNGLLRCQRRQPADRGKNPVVEVRGVTQGWRK